jgi:hypothetical protein
MTNMSDFSFNCLLLLSKTIEHIGPFFNVDLRGFTEEIKRNKSEFIDIFNKYDTQFTKKLTNETKIRKKD